MTELMENMTAKLDENLHRLFNEGVLDKASVVPVVVRCRPDSISTISGLISDNGGRVRHELPLFNAVAAWLPLSLIPELAQRDDITSLEFEECYSLA
jgi:hypothetical protein